MPRDKKLSELLSRFEWSGPSRPNAKKYWRGAIHRHFEERVAQAREVEGPWFTIENRIYCTSHDGEKRLRLVTDTDAEARAIANVRNAHHARRQAKEAKP